MLGKLKDLEPSQMLGKHSQEPLSLYRSLSDYVGTQSLLIHHETLEPGRRASRAHYHSKKEEITLILSGNPSVWLDGDLVALEPGDFIGFDAKNPQAHMLVNNSAEPAVFLTIGTNPEDDVTTFVEAER